MSPDSEAVPLDLYAAGKLEEEVEDLVEEWIEDLSRKVGLRPSRFLPSDELRDHVPSILLGVSRHLATPTTSVRAEVLDRIRLHGELRREQGFDLEEILIEFEKLTEHVFAWFRRTVERYPGVAEPLAVADLSCRLAAGMAEIMRVTLSTYRSREAEHRRRLGERMAEYARTISHELKNPLNAAIGSAKMLQEEELGRDQVQAFAQLLVRSLDRMDRLLQDIRELAFEEGAGAESRWIPLEAAVSAVFEELADYARSKDVRLVMHGDLPMIQVDAGPLEIALMNLVANSIKYRDPEKDERWVRVGARRIASGGPAGHGWLVEVEDNGLGIPDSLQDKVFRRHFRGHPEVEDGTGLGLAIARQVLTRRGGTMGFESTEGEGTRFWVTLPDREEWPERERTGEDGSPS